jgi:hypothetical protein
MRFESLLLSKTRRYNPPIPHLGGVVCSLQFEKTRRVEFERSRFVSLTFSEDLKFRPEDGVGYIAVK